MRFAPGFLEPPEGHFGPLGFLCVRGEAQAGQRLDLPPLTQRPRRAPQAHRKTAPSAAKSSHKTW